MGNRIGKISSIKRTYDTRYGQTLASSLADKGFTALPGTLKFKPPYKERNGSYRTGLDPEALYIKKMPEEAAKIEIERVTNLRNELEELSGLDLSPKSSYYSGIMDEGQYGGDNRAAIVKLVDGENVFNLDVVQDAITFAWLRVHPDIAPSHNAWQRGQNSHRCPDISACRFFVDDEEFQSAIDFQEKSSINKAINNLESMSPTRRFKVARLLNLPVSYNDKVEIVYNAIDTYIKDNTLKNGQKSLNVVNFNNVCSLSDETIEVKYKIAEALDFSVYRKGKAGKIYEGENLVADDQEELIEFLSNPKNQDDFLALLKKIESAKIVSF